MYRQLLILLCLLLIGCSDDNPTSHNGASSTDDSQRAGFTLLSPDFTDGGVIPPRFASIWMGGENIPPQLQWDGVPSATHSFTLLMEDRTNGAKHWSVFNIPSHFDNVTDLLNEPPPGLIEGMNYKEINGYAGPNPKETHLYRFTVYALNESMPLIKATTGWTQSEFEAEFDTHIIDKASLSGTFTPSKVRILFHGIKRKIAKLIG